MHKRYLLCKNKKTSEKKCVICDAYVCVLARKHTKKLQEKPFHRSSLAIFW